MPVRHDGPRGDDGARSKGAGACIACRAEQAVAALARLTAPTGARLWPLSTLGALDALRKDADRLVTFYTS